MRNHYPLVASLALSCLFSSAQAQSGHSLAAPAIPVAQPKLAFLLPNMFGPTGLRLDNPTHEAHFDSAFRENFGPLNSAIATQLTLLPIPSPASGFTYEFDAELGVYSRSDQSLGPILAERAETIGKGKFAFGIAHQSFSFDTLDDFDLGSIPSVFEHQPAPNPVFERDIITTSNFIDFQMGQTTLYFTYGATSRVDVSMAVPLVRAEMNAFSTAEIQRIGTSGDPNLPHTFNREGDETAAQFGNGGRASGLGDITVRVKGNVFQRRRVGLALGVDARLPTGDEFDFLGSGAYGFRPFAAISFNLNRVSPHVNLAYQWNGESVLAGNVVSGQKRKLPSQWFLGVGADVRVSPKLTFAGDYLGQRVVDADRILGSEFVGFDGSTFPQTTFFRDTFDIHTGSAGIKVNVAPNTLVYFNLMFKLNNAGMRDRVTPLFGIAYTN